jgi:F-type H+-transporting ATPase subunit b
VVFLPRKRPRAGGALALKVLLFGVAFLATGEARAEGLPQLNPDYFSSQVIWLAISFVVLYVVMSRIAIPRISHVIEERQRKIDETLRKAASLKEKAEAAKEAYEDSLATARNKAHEVLNETRDKLAAEAAEKQHDLMSQLDKKIKSAEESILGAKEQAMDDVRQMAIDVAMEASEKLSGEPQNKKTAASAVDSVIGSRK